MKNKPKGFGTIPNSEKLEQGLQKLSNHTEQQIAKLQKIVSTPSGAGEMDAFLGRKPRSNDSEYKAAYDKAYVARLLAPPEESANLKSMQVFAEQILGDFIS